MKILFRSILLIALAIALPQCEENFAPETDAYFEDAAVSATARKRPFVIKAIAGPENYPSNSFEFYLDGTPGHSVTIDWGDGTSTQDSLTGVALEKVYDAPGAYDITISGDTRAITGFKSYYGEGLFESADFSGLVNLQSARIGLTSGPAVLDFSSNRNLTELDLSILHTLSGVVLPKKHRISIIGIAGPNQMNAAQVDYVIKNIYENAVKGHIYNGSFDVLAIAYDTDFENVFLGPPSPASLVMLKTLQDSYGWTITPPLE